MIMCAAEFSLAVPKFGTFAKCAKLAPPLMTLCWSQGKLFGTSPDDPILEPREAQT